MLTFTISQPFTENLRVNKLQKHTRSYVTYFVKTFGVLIRNILYVFVQLCTSSFTRLSF